jgi:putative ABC transport system substrate-binding protein
MKRRDFITALGSVAAWPLAARAQQRGKVRRIGYLSTAPAFNHVDNAFQERLRDLGWINDQNATIRYGFSSGRQDRAEPVVAEALGANPEVLAVWAPAMSLAAKRATAATQVPLVSLLGGRDPVDIGLVPSMARPGGNITGVSALGSLEIFAKRLQLLKELVPSLSRVAILVSTEQQGSDGPEERLARAAKVLNIELREFVVLTPSDLEDAIGDAKEWGAQGLYTFASGFTFSFGEQINKIANAPMVCQLSTR